MGDYLRTYLEAGLSDIFIIETDEWEEKSGYGREHETETVVARKGDGFVKVKVHERTSFAPGSGGSNVGIESEESITEEQYCDLASNAPTLTNIDTEEAVAAINRADQQRADGFANQERLRKLRRPFYDKLEALKPDCPKCGKKMWQGTDRYKGDGWTCGVQGCFGFRYYGVEEKRLIAEIAKIR